MYALLLAINPGTHRLHRWLLPLHVATRTTSTVYRLQTDTSHIMSANGRGNMRPQSRSPPFLITGLVVALVILGANYWNMSSNNASLSAEVADLQDQIRILASKKNNYERKSDNAMLRIRDIEKNVNSKDQEVKSLKIELKELGSAKDACTNKLVSGANRPPEMTHLGNIGVL